MSYIGIDVSLRETGVAYYEPITGKVALFTIKSEMPFDVVKKLRHIIQPGAVVTFEDFGIAGRNRGAKLIERVKLLGALEYVALVESGMYPITVHPATLKKFFTGNGRASKEDMIKASYDRWHVACTNHNAVDALALAMFGFVRTSYTDKIYIDNIEFKVDDETLAVARK